MMKRKHLIVILVIVLLSFIIFLGYNLYNYINYVPHVEVLNEELNIIVNESLEDASQTINLILKNNY